MAFGSKRPDPRDLLIEALREEIRFLREDEIPYLRAALDEANKTNLALMNSYAYRQRYGQRHPEEPDTSAQKDPERSLSPSQLRARPVVPDFTMASVERQFIEQGSFQETVKSEKPKN
jgi:hypothetical protein